MAEPLRIQLSRKKGWRMPVGALKVDRSTRWGNPYALRYYQFAHADGTPAAWNEREARTMALRDFDAALYVGTLKVSIEDVQRELRGKDLACWCKLCPKHAAGKRIGVECSRCALCHADVLLKVANG